MKCIALIFALFFPLSSFGQKINFSDTSNLWKVFYYSCVGNLGASCNLNRYTSDTVYHGTEYRVLQDGFDISFIREDTTAEKVYAIRIVNSPSVPDTVEQLLYDYTLNIGDTFRCGVALHYVSSIDSVLINSNWYKTWFLSPFSCIGCPSSYTALPYYVIEGIGCTCEPLTPLYPVHFYESCIALTCFNNNSTTPPLSHVVGPYFDNDASCNLTFGLSISNPKAKINDATISPNPTNSKINVSANENINSIVVTNLIGQEVHEQVYNSEKVEIDVSKLQPCVYLIRINNTVVRKFVKE